MENIDKIEVETALLEAIWISRWTQSGQGLAAVLTEGEADHIVNNIFEELDKIGYEIKKKNDSDDLFNKLKTEMIEYCLDNNNTTLNSEIEYYIKLFKKYNKKK